MSCSFKKDTDPHMADKVVVRLKVTLDSIEELEQALKEMGKTITKSFAAAEFKQLSGEYPNGRFRVAVVDEDHLRRFKFGRKHRRHCGHGPRGHQMHRSRGFKKHEA